MLIDVAAKELMAILLFLIIAAIVIAIVIALLAFASGKGAAITGFFKIFRRNILKDPATNPTENDEQKSSPIDKDETSS